jgi:hypothetical protein
MFFAHPLVSASRGVRGMGFRPFLFSFFFVLFLSNFAHAKLNFIASDPGDEISFILVEGDFEYEDNLLEFISLVRRHNPSIVTFNSSGGNIVKSIELGRLIRLYGLNTFQMRGLECSSACSIAFMGGVKRHAEAGSIGVHQSSYGGTQGLSAEQAVSNIQAITAEVMSYMIEMGIDPALLHLSLSYDSNDIRYLSRSEMEKFKVINLNMRNETADIRHQSTPPVRPTPRHDTYGYQPDLSIPIARTGRVRHPKGSAPVKIQPDGDSRNLSNLRNGTPVRIISTHDRWYRLQAGSYNGYMHHTWVYVDQYAGGPYSDRHIQIKSFNNSREALDFALNSSFSLDVYLATNNWYAVTLKGTFKETDAVNALRYYRGNKLIPSDSFMTYGNTYARKICCNN